MLLLLLLPAHSSHRCRFAWAYKQNSCAYPAHLRLWKRVNARKHIHYWCTLHMLVWGDPIHHHRHQKKWSTWHRHAVDVADVATATAIAWTEQNTPLSIHLCMCREWEQRVRQRKCVNAFCYGCWQLYNQNKPRHIQLICTCTCYICIYVCLACMYSEKRREENSTVYTLESLKINITMIWALIFALSFSLPLTRTLSAALFLFIHFHHFPHSFDVFICLRTETDCWITVCVWVCFRPHAETKTDT